MTAWMLEHPWMTFFIAMALVGNVSIRLGTWSSKRSKDQS